MRTGGGRPDLSLMDRQEIIRLAQEGRSHRAISRAVGCSKSAVTRIIYRWQAGELDSLGRKRARPVSEGQEMQAFRGERDAEWHFFA